MGGLRIIAGKWRSRRIAAPPAERTRPMPDRVKEAIFDILGSKLGTPGELPPFFVADLFAGSGSLGLEAVSRGAAGCVFVERDRAALSVLRSNIDGLDPSATMRVITADAWRSGPSVLAGAAGGVGLVFIDPPYRDARDTGPDSPLVRLIERICRDEQLLADAVLVVHHERKISLAAPAEAFWAVVDRREYGHTAITFVQPVRRETGQVNPPAEDRCQTG